jgi:hypothetical protein
MMETKNTESEYVKYIRQLTRLCKGESEDLLKKALKDRLQGGGPPLLRDEGDRLDVLILVYSGLRKEGDERAMHRLRKLTVDILMENLRKHEIAPPSETTATLEQVDFPGHLAAWFEIKKDKNLSVDLADKLYGFLAYRLKVPVYQLMDLDGMALETAVRAFDLWLAATSWNESFKWPDHLQELTEKLYKNNINKLREAPRRISDTQIRLLLLTYRAVLRSNPFWLGQKGLALMTSCLDRLHNYSDKIMKKWWGLCHELKVIFRKKKEWREMFIKGLTSIRDVKNREIHFDELSPTMRKSLKTMGMEKEAVEKLGTNQDSNVKLIDNLIQSFQSRINSKDFMEALESGRYSKAQEEVYQ